jgi:beta-glucosidase
VRRWLGVLNRTAGRGTGQFDIDAHHALAREAAADGCVLLRNEPVDGTPLLPLTARREVAVIGEFARTPRYQGAGSSQVHPTLLDSALETLRAEHADVAFAAGFTIEGGPDGDDAALADEAVETARTATTVVLFAGLPAPRESEGFDRTDLDLPTAQTDLLDRILEVNPRVVVVLANGAVVRMPWRDRVPAIVEGWLGGQAGGSGVVDVLTGVVNPAGKLTETIPEHLTDTPAFGNFPGELGQVRYGEGLLVGYRWYDARQVEVAYPFGHGLSYTSFEYSDIAATVSGTGADATVEVEVTVTNTGQRAGAEVVQVYVGDPKASVLRPERELKAFAKVTLEPGGSQSVSFTLTARDLSYWHSSLSRWVVEGGEFVIAVGASSRDLRGQVSVEVVGEDLTLPLHPMSTVREAMAHPVAGPLLAQALAAASDTPVDDAMTALMGDMPLQVIADFGLSPLNEATLTQLIAAANAR